MKLSTKKVLAYKVVGEISGRASGMTVQGLLDNDSPQNFAKLGARFLEAAKSTNEHFQNRFEWPTFFLAFQSLELYLKSFLLSSGRKLDYVEKKIGHNVKKAFREAKAEGLVVSGSLGLDELVMDVGHSYFKKDFQYRSIGSFGLMAPDVLIGFVEQVRAASGN